MSDVIEFHSEPKRQGPLDGVTLPANAELTVSVNSPATRLILRCGPEMSAKVQSAFGIALPVRPNSVSVSSVGARAAIWLGPDEWLLMAPNEQPAALRSTLQAALSNLAHSLTDISHGQVGIELTGRLASRALSAGCPLDLRLAAFPPGMATRTIFLKSEIVLWRRSEDRFQVAVWRSFAPYLVGHLVEAVASAAGL